MLFSSIVRAVLGKAAFVRFLGVVVIVQPTG
jgi:hypothetical protein